MYCPNCGKEARQGARYCAYCRTKIREDGDQKTGQRSKLPIIFRVALIVLFVLAPWFDVSYIIGSSGVNLVSISFILSRLSSSVSNLAAMSGTSTSAVSGLAAISIFSLALAAVPVVCMAIEIYKYREPKASVAVGPYCALGALLIGALLVFGLNASINNALGDAMGGTYSYDIVSLGLGWWFTLIVVGRTIWFDHKVRGEEPAE